MPAVNEQVYEKIVRKAVETFPTADAPIFSCEKFDEHQHAGLFTDQLWEQLEEADFVIADISGQNPNVIYELGIRHARRDGTLLIADSTDSLPVNLANLVVISYARELDDPRDAIARIHGCLEAFVNGKAGLDSPFLTALSRRIGKGQLELPASMFVLGRRLDRGSRGRKPSLFRRCVEFSRGPLDPFRMRGLSFDARARTIRRGNEYLRRKPAGSHAAIFEGLPIMDGRRSPARSGFACIFHLILDEEMTKGSGFYPAGEEHKPVRRNYELHRLDPALRKTPVGRGRPDKEKWGP
jgi:hypothetical protein